MLWWVWGPVSQTNSRCEISVSLTSPVSPRLLRQTGRQGKNPLSPGDMKAQPSSSRLNSIEMQNRRGFLGATALGILGLVAARGGLFIAAAGSGTRKMTMNLVCGAIGVSADQRQAIELAAKYGFESVEAYGGYLASVSDDQLADLKESMREKRITFGASGLPVEFRQEESKFNESLQALPKIAKGLQRAGVDRVSTWLTPSDGKLTYLQNFRHHSRRLREVALLLKDHGIRLGLEYVGPKTSWTSRRYPFVHTMAEMKDLIADMKVSN